MEQSGERVGLSLLPSYNRLRKFQRIIGCYETTG